MFMCVYVCFCACFCFPLYVCAFVCVCLHVCSVNTICLIAFISMHFPSRAYMFTFIGDMSAYMRVLISHNYFFSSSPSPSLSLSSLPFPSRCLLLPFFMQRAQNTSLAAELEAVTESVQTNQKKFDVREKKISRIYFQAEEKEEKREATPHNNIKK